MLLRSKWLLPAAAALALLPAATASAAAVTGSPRITQVTCSGTAAAPGLLKGNYLHGVTVVGVCNVEGGAARVYGALTVSAGATLNATFAGPRSALIVQGDLLVDSGAVLLLGCEPNFAPCSDNPLVAGTDIVTGSILANGALGVVVHAATVGFEISQIGGGGGVSCAPSGWFATIQSPPYSTYEDVQVGGNLTMEGLHSCWTGTLRNQVGDALTAEGNVMADPDAGEILQNVVRGDLTCSSDSPSAQYGDSGAGPNVVYGHAFGACAFDTESPDPKWYFPGLVPQPNALIYRRAELPISVVPNATVGIVPSADANGYSLANNAGTVTGFGDGVSHAAFTSSFPFAAFVGDGGNGYWEATSAGFVHAFGGAAAVGNPSGTGSAFPIVAAAAGPGGDGLWLAGLDGGVFSYGSARFHGSEGGVRLNAAIVGMAATPDGRGYWLVAQDGGIFAFGDARFRGSEGSAHLNAPIVGMAATPDGLGYWLVAADGGIFAFGDARFHGSEGGSHVNTPIVGMAADPDGAGYWLVGEDGGVFNFGSARFFGSAA